MPPLNASSNTPARATYALRASDIKDILCHRKVDGVEEYLVRWTIGAIKDRAVCSWHTLPELWRCLHLVQLYLEYRPRAEGTEQQPTTEQVAALPVNRKRKLPGQEPARDSLKNDILKRNGLLTPQDRSRSPSVMSANSGSFENAKNDDQRSYGIKLRKKEGHLLGQPSNGSSLLKPDHLPETWIQSAAITPVDQAERFIWQKFLEMLRPVGNVRLENKVDTSTPSLNFTFITRYVLRNGITETPSDAVEGCPLPCKPNMGGNCGCEYTQKCACLEFAAVDADRLQAKDPAVYEEWKKAEKARQYYDTMGLPKRFPYSKQNKNSGASRPQTLVTWYLDRRDCIYECNQNCNCGDDCKSRLVQNGRQVPLTIFKTGGNRGWGVYCNEDLIQGEFIDTYLGEVITDAEAKKRGDKAGSFKHSYLYNLDKFKGDSDPAGKIIEDEDCYVVDGQYMGGVTRFINHSCEPNCRQYTVSCNKNDPFLYNLAFFAWKNIPAGTELTFDYVDEDELDLVDAVQAREKALADPENQKLLEEDKLIRCRCGTRKCRGFLWLPKDDESKDGDSMDGDSQDEESKD